MFFWMVKCGLFSFGVCIYFNCILFFLLRVWLVKDIGFVNFLIYKCIKLFLFNCRLVIEGEVVSVYYILENF